MGGTGRHPREAYVNREEEEEDPLPTSATDTASVWGLNPRPSLPEGSHSASPTPPPGPVQCLSVAVDHGHVQREAE